MNKSIVLLSLAAALLLCALPSSQAQVSIPYTIVTNDPPVYGPYNGIFLADGEGLYKKLTENDTVLVADSPWTLYAWVNSDEAVAKPTLIAGLGKPEDEYARYLAIAPGKLILFGGKDNSLEAICDVWAGRVAPDCRHVRRRAVSPLLRWHSGGERQPGAGQRQRGAGHGAVSVACTRAGVISGAE